MDRLEAAVDKAIAAWKAMDKAITPADIEKAVDGLDESLANLEAARERSRK